MTFLLKAFKVYFNSKRAPLLHLREWLLNLDIFVVIDHRPVNCLIVAVFYFFYCVVGFLVVLSQCRGIIVLLFTMNTFTFLSQVNRFYVSFSTISQLKTFFAMDTNIYFVQMFWLHMAPQTRFCFEKLFTHFTFFGFFHMHALYVKFQVGILCEWFVTEYASVSQCSLFMWW